jgi:type I restriction-modification system DNA methylase subunit
MQPNLVDSTQLTWITNFIWGIADDVLRDIYVRGKYRDVILSTAVIRRLDAVLEPTKQEVLRTKELLDGAGLTNIQDKTIEINKAIDDYRKEIDLMQEYRSGLIADVVTGKLDVREAAARLPDWVEEKLEETDWEEEEKREEVDGDESEEET